jgi:predicted transcriptional regulator
MQPSVKEKVLKAISEMPSSVTSEEVFEQIWFLRKIEQGLKEVTEGTSIRQSEVEAKILQKWQK